MWASVSQARSPPQRDEQNRVCVGERNRLHALSVGGLVVRLHSIVRDGHRAGCEAQTEGCRVMGVMEWIADEQLNEVGKLLRGSVGVVGVVGVKGGERGSEMDR